MEDSQALAQAISLSETISRYPLDHLKQHSDQIERLSAVYRHLLSSIKEQPERDESPEKQSRPTEDERICQRHVMNGSDLEGPLPISMPAPETESQNHKRAIVRGVLQNAVSLESSIFHAASLLQGSNKWSSKLSIRESHIQDILTLQKRKGSVSERSPERILAICACVSLAKDFHDFEQQGGWIPKQTLLIERVLRGEDTAIQTVGKNVK